MNCRIIRVTGMFVVMGLLFTLGIVNAESNDESISAEIRQEHVLELEDKAEDADVNMIIDVQNLTLQQEVTKDNPVKKVESDYTVVLKLVDDNGVTRISDSYGNYYKGIHEINGKLYYADEESKVVYNKFFIYKGKAYISGSDGSLQVGVVYSAERNFYYYCDPEDMGAIKVTEGIVEWNGKRYHVNKGGNITVDRFFVYGKAYIAGKDGSIQTGVVYSPERKFYYYCDPVNNGAIKATEGIIEWNGKRYHVNKGGNITIDRFFVYGKAYIAGKDGSIQTGVVYSPERKFYYYCDPVNNGGIKVAEGIIDWNGHKYFVNDGGNIAVNRFMVIKGKAYIAGKNGAFQTGVVYNAERKFYYYCDPENGGAIRVTESLVDWNGNRYHVNKGGNITVNRFFVCGKAYIAGSNGAVKKGIVYSPERYCYYYCDPDDFGAIRIAEGDVLWNGETYHILNGGKVDNVMVIKANKLLDEIGHSLYNAYKYLAEQPYYRMYVSTSNGKEWFAEFGFSRGEGNCYVKTAMLYYMAKAMGYDNIRAVDGYCLGYQGERLPHGWLEYYENGKTYIIDPTFENEVGRNGYMIQYGQKGTWKYLPNESRTWIE